MELIVSFASGASNKSFPGATSLCRLAHSAWGHHCQLAPFDKMPQLYDSASFDWGGVSSEHHLAASWKLDLQHHSAVYQQLASKLGQNHPMSQLIQKELDKEVGEPASKMARTSSSSASFWQATAKSFQKTLGDVVQDAEKMTVEPVTEAAWQADAAAPASSTEEASGRVDGSFGSLQSGEGNIPLRLKLELANQLGSFNP